MKTKIYLVIVSIIFLVIGLSHLIRAFLQWPASINNLNIPIWLSYIVAIIALLLSYSGFRLVNKK